MSTASEIIVTNGNPLDIAPAAFAADLERRQNNRRALMEWVRAALVDGTDFGSVNTKRGPSKPSLRKPGAEKIAGMLGLTVHYPNLAEYERAAVAGADIAAIILRCELRGPDGRAVAEGIGARRVQQDQGDLNKALKMAAKSAHIDAILRCAGLSEVFTQDLEDMHPEASQPAGQRPAPAPPPRHNGPANIRPLPPLTLGMAQGATEKRRLEAEISRHGLDRERVKAWCTKKWGIKSLNDLPLQFVPELLRRFPVWREQAKASKPAPPVMIERPAVACTWEPDPPDIAELLVTARCECGAEIEGTFHRINAAGWIIEDKRFAMCKKCAVTKDASVPAGGIVPVQPDELRRRAASVRQSAQYADDPNARRRDMERADQYERDAMKTEKYLALTGRMKAA